MQKPSFSHFIKNSKKFIPFVVVVIILGIAVVIFFSMRTPKLEPLTPEQKQDFINYIDSQKIKPITKKQKQDFITNTATTKPLTQEEKDSFLKSVR